MNWLLADLIAALQQRGQGLPVRDPPLPGGVADFLRALFGLPPWVQITAIVLGALAAVGLAVVVWMRRRALADWLGARSLWFKVGLGAAALVALVSAVTFGRVSWNYTQHNNDFCTVCHVMSTPYKKFQLTRHATIQCHDCHQQSIMASMHELRVWILDRPESIKGKRHTPNARCVACHVNSDPVKWKQIAATAGHRVHLESTRRVLQGVQCVKCHGVSVHEFVPVRQTCGQNGCHRPADTKITLGRMAALDTDLHCTMCHEFLRAAPTSLPTDSARQGLTPGQNQCMACHQTLVNKEFGAEVHGGVCGSCHNPHRQPNSAAAVRSCAGGGCHAQSDTLTPFHRGLHAGVQEVCTNCHQAHTWKVRGSDCAACHRPAQLDKLDEARGTRPQRRADAPGDTQRINGLTRMSIFPLWWLGLLQQVVRPQATGQRQPFLHRQHTAQRCTSCHTSAERHGALTVTTAADCSACHHSAANRTRCTGCHTPGELSGARARTMDISMSVWPAARERTLSFAHELHTSTSCTSCHTDSPRVATTKTCAGCHTQHHDVARTCTRCHQDVTKSNAHDRRVHLGCTGSGCHSEAALPKPIAARSVCLACHPTRVNHQPGGDCASCHLIPLRADAVDARRRP